MVSRLQSDNVRCKVKPSPCAIHADMLVRKAGNAGIAKEFESLLASLKKEAGLMPGEEDSEPEVADFSLLDEHLDVDEGAAVH